jgi:hypothetical protein
VIVDGQTYVIRGVERLFARENIGEMTRFVCTLVVGPADDALEPI